MKTQKISKGFYKINHPKGLIYIAHDRDVEGECKWNVWSDEFEILEYMDGLWYTKSEAVMMIQSEIN